MTAATVTKMIPLFQGVLTRSSYNGLRPLDLAHDKSDRTRIRGSVKVLTSIPYDYKDLNPDLFVDSGIQSTAQIFSQDGSGNCSVLLPLKLSLSENSHLKFYSTKLFIRT